YGNSENIAGIVPLAHGGFFVHLMPGAPHTLLGLSQNGLYDKLPWFLDDMRPQGFIGRKIGEQLATKDSGFPPDPRRWNNEQLLRYLLAAGDDLPGNLQCGDRARICIRRKPESADDTDYPALADEVMGGYVPSSSAGGEQPKFTIFNRSQQAHVIVKFTPKDDNAVAERWRDILVTEHHAAEILTKSQFPSAAKTRLLEAGGRLFLESQRFDRSREYGRLSMFSLQAVDNEFAGVGTSWPEIMMALHNKKLVSWEHTFDAACLFLFGRLINNTDMHPGNLSLAMEGDVFKLLPAYDMCSMGFAPRPNGELPPFAFKPPFAAETGLMAFSEEQQRNIRQHALERAIKFWDAVAGDSRISPAFREFLHVNPVRDLVI
ncbi:MAG: HipA domain-containing protein, partial [Deltaproteobacteria bacterium]|nr:HipA domain-containing protein [Deltaproteobacteria bacterium]